LALTAAPKPVDVGYLGERHFLNVAGIGFDAAVGNIFNRRRKRGAVGYLTAFYLVWQYEPRACRLELDDEALEGERFLIVFANGREYGNGVIIAPDANFTDGRLDALIVAAGSPFHQLWRARRLVIGRRRPASGLRRRQFTSARLTGEALQCHVDGETFDFSGTLDVRVRPLALNVIRT
jgi:diacylglycerol kinase (ATP)